MRNRYFQRGFTFVEMLIVLSVIAALSSLTLIHLQPAIEAQKHQFFLHQLQRDLYYSQSYALNHNKIVAVYFFNSAKKYEIKADAVTLIRREYSEQVDLSFRTLPNPLIFRPNGNTTKSGSMQIKIDNDHYLLVVLLGKGRFYVKKE